jgi:Tfp pilus assembly protein PilF
MLLRSTLLAMLVVVTSCSSTNTTTQTKQEREAAIYYGQGTSDLMNKNYTQALGHLMRAVEHAPKNPEYHNNLGMAYYFKGEKEMARQHIKRALELDKKNTDARINLASLAFENGDLNEAEKLYLQALKDLAYEKHARTYYNLALIELRRRNNQRALANLDRSIKEEESYCPAWFQKGMLDYQARRFKPALENFRRAGMGACAQEPAPIYWQAVTMIEMGEYLNARLKLDKVITEFSSGHYGTMAQQKISELNMIENQGERRQNATMNSTPSPSF